MIRPRRTHTILAAFARLIVQLVSYWRVSQEELLSHSGLTEAEISDPLARLPLERMLILIARARALTGEPGLGWYAGLQIRISAYGFLGFGILSAATIRDAIELVVRFNPLLATILDLRLEADCGDGRAAIVIEENADLGAARDFILGGVLVAFWQLGFCLSGSRPTATADLVIPEPDYYRRIIRADSTGPFIGRAGLESVGHLGPPVRFDRQSNRLFFDRSKLELALLMSDAAANRLAREQCEQALGEFSGDLVERVRRAITTRDGFRSLEEVAAELHLSTRTLKRHLADRGLTFTALAVEARRDRALLFLRSSSLSVDEIAERLGYSTTTSFIRAFQSWTAMSPTAYRRRARSAEA
jgi:AraC-like DNA-binding protein